MKIRLICSSVLLFLIYFSANLFARELYINNHSFESGGEYPSAVDGWSTTGVTAITTISVPSAGWDSGPSDSTLRVLFTNTNNAIISQRLPSVTREGYTYTLSLEAGKSNGSHTFTGIYASLYSSEVSGNFTSETFTWHQTVAITAAQVPTASFTTFSASYTEDGSHAGENLYIQIQITGGWQPCLDNIHLTETPVAAPAGGAVYGLRNGWFRNYQYGEQAQSPTDWSSGTVSGSYTFSTSPARSWIQNYETSAVITAVTSGSAYWKQTVDFPAGDYTLTADVNAPSGTTARLTAGGSNQDVSGNGSWQSASLNFTVSDGSSDVFLYSLGAGSVKFRRVELSIRGLTSASIDFDDATTLGRIVVDANATDAEKFAAYELQRCIKKMTGSAPGLYGRDTTYTGRYIIIGSAVNSAIRATLDNLADDSYRIKIDGSNNINLAGNTDRGTLYAVYDFLRTQGCGWFMPGKAGEELPTLTQLVVPSLDRTEEPAYDQRGVSIPSFWYLVDGYLLALNVEDYLDWSLRNGINTLHFGEYGFTAEFGSSRGRGISMSADHSYRLFLRPEHTEWWALVDSVRTATHPSGRPNQLCVSNQELRDFVVLYIINYFEADPNRTIFAINASDEPCYWCECSSCRALDANSAWTKDSQGVPNASMSDRTVDFVNEIASRVAAVCPGKRISMNAYGSTRFPPTTTGLTVDPNVVLNYCYSGPPVNKSVMDANYSENVTTISTLNGWDSNGVAEFRLYDYGGYLYPDSPFFMYYSQTSYLKELNEHWNFLQCLGEHWNSVESSMMLYNLRARSYWDPDINYVTEINDICTKFYGPAAGSMYQYYMYMNQIILDSTNLDSAVYLSDFNVPNLEGGRDDLESAYAAAGSDNTLKERIDYARFGHAAATIQMGQKNDPVLDSDRIAVGNAFYLARSLADTYDIKVINSALFQTLSFVPVGYTWDRSVDWTDNNSPDDDMFGYWTWYNRYVDRGNALGSSPWYQQTSTNMTWNSTYWKYSSEAAPCIYSDRLQCDLATSSDKNPVSRWVNSTLDIVDVNFNGTLTVEWGANCDVTNVDVVIAQKDVSRGIWIELLSETVGKPTQSKIGTAESANVTVDLTSVRIGLNDEIVVSMRPVANTTSGVINLYDNITYEAASIVPATTTEAYVESPDTTWISCNTYSSLQQSFTVPAGQELVKVEIMVGDCGQTNSSWYADVTVYKGDYGSGVLVQSIAVSADKVADLDWLPITLDVPQSAGTYYIQLSSDETYKNYLHGLLDSGSTYSGGRAAGGGTLLGTNDDFWVRFTTAAPANPVLDTYTGEDYAWYGCSTYGTVKQSFAVPAGKVFTKVEMLVGDCGQTNSSWYAKLALYKGAYGSGTLVQLITVPAADVVDCAWMAMALDVPQSAGTYYVELWSDQSYNTYLNGLLYSGSSYSDGRAGAGSTLLDSDQDFAVRLSTDDIYPVTPTYTVTPGPAWYCSGTAGSIQQSFTVPAGKVLTQVEMIVGDCGRTDAGWYAKLALYKGAYGSGTLVQMITVAAADLIDSAWLAMALDVPQGAGTYYVSLWSDQAYNSYLYGLYYSDSGYSDGEAAAGLTPLTPANRDFTVKFTTASATAKSSYPSPAMSATGVSVVPALTWVAGLGATSHDVYLGTSLTAVYDANHSYAEYKTNQAGTSYTPATLSANTTYYWRIDEVGAGGTTNGTVWSFTTETPPTFVSAGSITSGTGTITPALPGSITTGDILLLFIETSNQAVSISNQNGGMWTQVTNSPQYTGTAAGTTGVRLATYWSRYNGTQGNPTVSDSGDHQMGRIIAIRGAVSSGDPWNVTAGGVEAASDTSGSIPGATTTATSTLVVTAIASALPDATGTANFSSWTNANLASLTERTDNTVNSGNGGGIGVATGIKATAGAYGNTAVTLGSSAYKAMMSIAIKP